MSDFAFVPPEGDEFVVRRLVLAFSDQDLAKLRREVGEQRWATVCARRRSRGYGPEDAQWLTRQVRGATVGTHLLLAGPEDAVAAARTEALAAGMVPGEICALTRPRSARRVYCPHCRTVTADAPLTGTSPCAGCGRELEVFDHFSRGLTAHLGAQAGAEELVPAPAGAAADEVRGGTA